MLETLRRLPLREWQLLKGWFRRRYATVSWPDARASIVVDVTPGRLERHLRDHHWEDASGWSLKYEGEILNVRRPAGTDAQGRAMEDHLRARLVDGGTEIVAHYEPSRWEHKADHVAEDGLTWYDADALAALLADAGLDTGDL